MTVMTEDARDEADIARETFKQMMLAAHPDKSDEIFAMFNKIDPKSAAEAVEQIIPQTENEVRNMLREIQRFGLSLQTDGDIALPSPPPR
jgi:N-methylhydantoinase B/oxoprolinase/acetone carboxylase alpha subunit